MEDNIQTIITVIIATFILFIFPVYMAYEKKDDISYALAMRYTQDLVNEVRSKGYITKDMYDDYKAWLLGTGNTFDIELRHEYNRYDPITNYYTIGENDAYKLVKTSTVEQRKENEELIINAAIQDNKLSIDPLEGEKQEYLNEYYKKQGIYKIYDTYQVSKEIYTTDHILAILNSEKKLMLNNTSNVVECLDNEERCQYAYTMNIDDTFNVTIKNTNITLATLIYNMVTANVMDTNTRIYVNYGGTILSSKWYGKLDYEIMKHDNITLSEFSTVQSIGNYDYDNNRVYHNVNMSNVEAGYILEFDVVPYDITQLGLKGLLTMNNSQTYNFAMGSSNTRDEKSKLSVGVGINGVSLIVSNAQEIGVKTVQKAKLPIVNGSQRKFNEYKEITLASNSNNTTYLACKLPDGSVENMQIKVNDPENLLAGFRVNIEDTSKSTYSLYNDATDTQVYVNIDNDSIGITAAKNVSVAQTILTYPITIDSFIHVKLEVVKNDRGNYIVVLYLDDQRIAESIELFELPKIDTIGKTFLLGNEYIFNGKIKNIKLYK